MAPARSLHEIITGLTGDAGTPGDLAAVLRDGGHTDLPEELLAEAVVSFADTARAEVAEHLAPFVMAHGPIVEGDTAAGDIGQLPDLLATAPAAALDESSTLAMPEIDPPLGAGDDETRRTDEHSADEHTWAPLDTDFGHGHGLTEAPVDDVASGAVAPDAEPVGYADLPELDNVAPPADELWAAPSLPGDAPEIDDIDGD
ncbi:hypothetical protein [Couchioplanes caeruleus]|uniref:Uncharacterized protein n=2 Tax=Couchioplanes caeruleus TaxID=56438 RepID=A0A1K0FT26_9ACTN|nr:hypothetical protein [Couchioplanes caeruleus]OJF15929.1 hypothetical protein BG844_01465 [Couchioplanes caeruleus subsp. caeruleus]ROP28517.1 hypothetical protein EDD30_1281 [Couchioplanes caeruleus]